MAADKVVIYHNARCSKSRCALGLLEEAGSDVEIIDYLKTPPTEEELTALIALLGIRPKELVRTGEDIFKTTYAGKTLTPRQWVKAMVKHPILIERPIVVSGNRAVIGRPPEKVLELI